MEKQKYYLYPRRLICQICRLDLKTPVKKRRHITKVHKMDYIEYYDKYFKIIDEDICNNLYCNKKTKFNTYIPEYKKYCSTKCYNDDPLRKKYEDIKKKIEKLEVLNSYRKCFNLNYMV